MDLKLHHIIKGKTQVCIVVQLLQSIIGITMYWEYILPTCMQRCLILESFLGEYKDLKPFINHYKAHVPISWSAKVIFDGKYQLLQ